MTPTCPSCAALTEENHYLRRLLALELDLAKSLRISNALNLTIFEGRILGVLLERKHLITSVGLLFDALHSTPHSAQGDEDTIRVLVVRLRAKLGKDIITTFRGQGHQLAHSTAVYLEDVANALFTPPTNLEAHS